ncbi:MAG: hypothetical protein F2840_14820 [Actinobacteria bacterium]|uniref:Unannotated protein n=1 Tax=freshwater metagenome TaxID=449393 RepID=A0A6J7LLH0_9ZZZZ|nr:hypothetical protein [Actinomycetota bacterium]
MNHPSIRAVKQHRADGEPMCPPCAARLPHGKGGYDAWGCRCSTCSEAARNYRLAVPMDLKHPSTKAARAHSRAGEPLCSACLARAPHGSMSGYTAWYCRCELCRDAWSRKYESSKTTILRYQELYRDRGDNREKIRSRDRRFRMDNPELVRERQRTGRAMRRGRSDAEVAAAQDRLRPGGLKACRDCRDLQPLQDFYRDRLSPDGHMADCRTCDDKKRYGLSVAEYDEIIRATDGLCVYCGGPHEALDHVVPKLLGGADSPENLVPACRRCNGSKLASPLKEWWPRHLAEHLSGVPPIQTGKALGDLLAAHGLDTFLGQ